MQSGNSNYTNTTILTRSPLMQFITIQSLGMWQCVQGTLDSQHTGPLVVHGQGKKHHKVISVHKTRGFVLSLWFKREKKTPEKLVSSTATSKIGTVFQAFINQIRHMQFKLCFPCHINILMNLHQWVELKIYSWFTCLIISVEFCNQ